MAEYISRDWLLTHTHTGMDTIQMMQTMIDAPAADVVEVVRCKNCKNRYLWLFCGYFGDEDYCPKGAKMDGGVSDAAD